jgi:hypothetical protein
LVAGVIPAAADGKPRLRHAQFSATELVADGARYAVSQPQQGALVVRDELRGTRRVVPVGDDCRVQDAHRGVFLVNCDYHEPFVLTPGAATTRAVPGLGTSYDPNNETMSAIGTRWVQGVTKEDAVFYVNWHTGKRKDFGEIIEGQHRRRDLDSRDLRRVPKGFIYASKNLTIKTMGRRVVLKRRGRPAVDIDACVSGCVSVSIGGGFVTWGNYDTAEAFDLRTLRHYRWKFDRVIAGSDFGFGVQHTRRHIYINLPQAAQQPTTFDVLGAPWPR